MAYSPPPGGHQAGWDPNQPPPPQPGWNPNQPPPQHPGHQPQPGTGAPQPGAPGQPPEPPGGYGPPPGMPPGGYPPQPPKKRKTGLIVGCSLVVVILVAGIAMAIIQPWSDSDSDTGGTTSTDSDQDSDTSDHDDDTNGGPASDASPEQVVVEFMDKAKELALNPAAVDDPIAVIEEIRPYICADTQAVIDELADDLGEEDFNNNPESGTEDADLNAEFNVVDSNTEGDTAVVTVEMSYIDPITESDQTDTEEWELLLEDGEWKICDAF